MLHFKLFKVFFFFISDDLNWKLVYVGSSESEKYDQVLEDVVVGPIFRGPNEFVLNAPCPKGRLPS